MSPLVKYREQLHLTQDELAELAGISVRTIQRVEAGAALRGYTLKALSKALGVSAADLLGVPAGPGYDYRQIRLINLAALPFVVLPPLNILAQLLLMYRWKAVNALTRQLLSLQILWTVIAGLFVLGSAFLNRLFDLDFPFVVIAAALAAGCNLYILIRNAVAIDRQQELRIRPGFSFF